MDHIDEEIYLQLEEDARIAAAETDYHMTDREYEAFVERYIEQRLKQLGYSC